ncbi:MAG: membrane protein [Rhodobacter sp. CACIA14H1]|nr:MAG: membrane protein [Rhodobacter sp. CACIA14H1]
MKRITAFAAASSVAAFAALPALAGGPVTAIEEPMIAPAAAPVAVAPNGDWSGLYAGGQLGFADVGGDGILSAIGGDDMTAGILGGYRMDFGQFVAGVEANYDWADVDLGGGDSLDNIARLKLIGGFDMGNALLYGTVAAVRADATIAGAELSDNGWGAGLGVDYAVSDRMTVGAELMEHRFDNFAGTGDLDATTLNARVGFKF